MPITAVMCYFWLCLDNIICYTLDLHICVRSHPSFIVIKCCGPIDNYFMCTLYLPGDSSNLPYIRA